METQTAETDSGVQALTKDLLEKCQLPSESTPSNSLSPSILLCDAGYGLPREARPRKEKILAISRQLANFLTWQNEQKNKTQEPQALVEVVSCPDEATCQALQQRTLGLLSFTPSNVSFSCQPWEDACATHASVHRAPVVYLSPDAEESLDFHLPPPQVVVVGLLIDRRVQLNRSKERAELIAKNKSSNSEASDNNTTTDLSSHLVAKRWPLEDCGFVNIHANEPLNVDCVLEGMQQWWWNAQDHKELPAKEHFVQAAMEAIHRHADRHPSRPVHRSVANK